MLVSKLAALCLLGSALPPAAVLAAPPPAGGFAAPLSDDDAWRRLPTAEIAGRSRLRAGDDWSSFTPAEQHAFAFARTLTKTPWAVSDAEIEGLERDFGPDRALIVALNACRYHDMTRISNGFQLRLERENVFYDYYNMNPPAAGAS